MKLLKQLTPSCVLYSAAMMLNEEPENLAKEIGHDGMERWWPDLPSPSCFRGVSVQEIQDVCFARGLGLVHIHAFPCIAPIVAPLEDKPLFDMGRATERFLKMVHGKVGMFLGQAPSGVLHAVAWDGHKCFDPNGRMYGLSDFPVKEAWLLVTMP